MSDGERGWFAAEDPVGAVRDGRAEEPRDWPAEAIARGAADDEADYYDRLQAATVAATRATVEEREGADDRQLVHAVRALDDLSAALNELAERAAEWAAPTLAADPDASVAAVRDLADRDPDDPFAERVVALAASVDDLAEQRDALRATIEREAPAVAPNLSALAGPVLAARLMALAGGLESLAKLPSGTVQVLGAEDALFAHLRGEAPSPKHGVIFTHEYVRNTHPDQRGSAARALAGKLSIAARIDHYAGDRRPELEADLDERIARIRRREEATDGQSDESADETEVEP